MLLNNPRFDSEFKSHDSRYHTAMIEIILQMLICNFPRDCPGEAEKDIIENRMILWKQCENIILNATKVCKDASINERGYMVIAYLITFANEWWETAELEPGVGCDYQWVEKHFGVKGEIRSKIDEIAGKREWNEINAGNKRIQTAREYGYTNMSVSELEKRIEILKKWIDMEKQSKNMFGVANVTDIIRVIQHVINIRQSKS